MERPFVRLPASLYDGGSRTSQVDRPYAQMVAALGEPHKNGELDYPDDTYKTDVCWCVQSNDGQNTVAIWNYKNGPAYNDGEGSIEELDYFSVYYTNHGFWKKILAYIDFVNQEVK